MDPFDCYNYKEAIGHEMGFTIIEHQGYSRLIDNIQRIGKIISNTKLELKRGRRQTAQIAEPLQGGKASLKFVVLHCA